MASVGSAEEEGRRAVAKKQRLVLASANVGWRRHQWQARGERGRDSGQARSQASDVDDVEVFDVDQGWSVTWRVVSGA